MNAKDCCCFCFSARTGLLIIGAFLMFDLLAKFGTCIYFTISWDYLYWYEFPMIILTVILVLKFRQVLKNEYWQNDYETREEFYKMYLVLCVIV